MMSRSVKIFLILLVVVIIAIIIIDYRNDQADKRGGNPFEYSVDEYKSVDDSLLVYKETRQLKLQAGFPKGITYDSRKIFLIADDYLQILSPEGNALFKSSLADTATSISVKNDTIVVGFRNYIKRYTFNEGLEEKSRSETYSNRSYITSVDFSDNHIFAADAGERVIIVFDNQCNEKTRFSGISESGSMHGFIVPSPNFDLKIDTQGELWVANPGKHALQWYTTAGDLVFQWKKTSLKTDGFTGCCNPAHFTILKNGNFITSEKGLVRIKEYDQKGNLLAVVGEPAKFNSREGKAPDVTSDEHGTVIALDYEMNMIRFFERKEIE